METISNEYAKHKKLHISLPKHDIVLYLKSIPKPHFALVSRSNLIIYCIVVEFELSRPL
jgi:hypothetical protein